MKLRGHTFVREPQNHGEVRREIRVQEREDGTATTQGRSRGVKHKQASFPSYERAHAWGRLTINGSICRR